MTNYPNFLAHRLTRQGVVGELAADYPDMDSFGDMFTNSVGAEWIPRPAGARAADHRLYAYPKGLQVGTERWLGLPC